MHAIRKSYGSSHDLAVMRLRYSELLRDRVLGESTRQAGALLGDGGLLLDLAAARSVRLRRGLKK